MSGNKTAKYQLDALRVARAAGRRPGWWGAPGGGRRGGAMAADAHQEWTVSDLHWLTATEIGAAYAARRLSPVELVQALPERIETRDPQVNAFIMLDAEGALDAARQAEKEIVAGRSRGPL